MINSLFVKCDDCRSRCEIYHLLLQLPFDGETLASILPTLLAKILGALQVSTTNNTVV